MIDSFPDIKICQLRYLSIVEFHHWLDKQRRALQLKIINFPYYASHLNNSSLQFKHFSKPSQVICSKSFANCSNALPRFSNHFTLLRHLLFIYYPFIICFWGNLMDKVYCTFSYVRSHIIFSSITCLIVALWHSSYIFLHEMSYCCLMANVKLIHFLAWDASLFVALQPTFNLQIFWLRFYYLWPHGKCLVHTFSGMRCFNICCLMADV